MGIQTVEFVSAANPVSLFNPIAFTEGSTKERLQPSFAEIVERICGEMDEIVSHLMDSPTLEDFQELRKSLFESYLKLGHALNNVALAKLDKKELPGLIDASFTALEAEIASAAEVYFGNDAYQEIMFSIGTLKRAYRWIPHIISNEPKEELRAQDAETATNFNVSSMWSQFHLDALRIAMRRNQTIIPEILEELLEGLRLSVMVYAYVRNALNLRGIPAAHQGGLSDVIWDEEDEALANAY
ncbi:MAG: hypothetical protein AB1631_24445 [Acidobacteriota bacterium]